MPSSRNTPRRLDGYKNTYLYKVRGPLIPSEPPSPGLESIPRGLERGHPAIPNKFQIDTKPNECIGFGAMDVTKPYKFIGSMKQ